MLEKTIFEINKKFQYLSTDAFFSQDTEICVGNVYDAVYSIALKYGGKKKAQVVCREKDFSLVGSSIFKALKDVGSNYAVLLVEDVDFDNVKKNNSFHFSQDYVIAVGGEDLLSLARYYADKRKVDCHAVITEPAVEFAFTNSVKIPTGGIPLKVEVAPFKSVTYDVSVIKKAPNSSFATAYILVISKLIALIDYKMYLLLSAKPLDSENYKLAKETISLIANISKYKNPKDALIYAETVISLIRAKSSVLDDFSLELFADALCTTSLPYSKGDRVLISFLKLTPLYHMFFSNDFTDVLSMPNYVKDCYELESVTGKYAGIFLNNVKIPSQATLKTMGAIVNKTKDGFKKETSSVLSIIDTVKKIYYILYKEDKKIEYPPYSELKRALKLCSYLSDKESVLKVIRDFGVLNCLDA